MKTKCCNYDPPKDMPYPVMWNEFNQVVQCHNCGEVWLPVSDVLKAFKDGQDTAMKWVGEECKRQTERLTGDYIEKMICATPTT